MFGSIKTAHLSGKLKEEEVTFIKVPDGRCEHGECGVLKRLLYGMRPAASSWGHDYS